MIEARNWKSRIARPRKLMPHSNDARRIRKNGTSFQVMLKLVRVGDYVVRGGGEELLLIDTPMPRKFVSVLGERIRTWVAEHPLDISEDPQSR